MAFMYMRNNRTQHKRSPDDYGEVVLAKGFISKDKEHYYFRPDRGSGGFALYKTERNAKSAAASDAEDTRRVRLVLSFY